MKTKFGMFYYEFLLLLFLDGLSCFKMSATKTPKPSRIALSNVAFPTGFSASHNYKSSSCHMGQNPIIVRSERGVFAHSLCSSFAQKLHALVAVGQSRAIGRGGRPLSGWSRAGEEEETVLHGNRLIVCMDEVMRLAGHQTQPE